MAQILMVLTKLTLTMIGSGVLITLIFEAARRSKPKIPHNHG